MLLEAGRIVLIVYPFTDLSGAKLRPALVVSSQKFNAGEDFVAVPISSRVDPNDKFGYPIHPSEKYFAKTRLKCASTVKWSKPMTLSRRVVHRTLGVVPQNVLRDVQERLKSLFG